MNAMKQALIAASIPVAHPIPSRDFPCMTRRGEQQIGPDHQRCTKCHTIKPLHAFHQHAKRRSGRHPRCKACRNAYNQQRRIAA